MIKTIYVNFDVTHPDTFLYEDKGTHDWWLMIQTTTYAEFFIEDKFVTFEPYQVVIYPPFSPILYRACKETYANHWIRFYTDEPFIINATLPVGIPFHVADPNYIRELYRLISIEHFFDNKLCASSIQYLFQILFNKYRESFANDYITATLPFNELTALRQEIGLHPNLHWTVSSMAKKLNISTAHLHVRYKEAFGTTCMKDVIKFRISLAKEHLYSSTYSIKEIADLCGYENVEHFSRQFKKNTGLSPQEYRDTSCRF